MLEQLLGDQKNDLIRIVMEKLGVSSDQAGGFVGKLLPMIEDLVGQGKIDASALLKGDVSSLVKGLDLNALGATLGGSREKAEAGVDAVANPIAKQLEGLDDPMAMLNGLIVGDKSDLLKKATGGLGKLFGS